MTKKNSFNFARAMRVWILMLGFMCPLELFASYKVVFSPNPERKDEIFTLLESAVNTLDICMYGLSDSSIKEKIIEAAQQGVVVRMLLHDADKRMELASELEAAGIDVRYTSRTNHNKFVIVDGPQSDTKSERDHEAALAVVMTGSGNFSRSSTTIFDDDLVVVSEQAPVAYAYQFEFNWLWQYSNDFEGDALAIAGSAQVDWPEYAGIAFSSHNIDQVKEYGEGWRYYSKLSKDETGVLAATVIAAIDSVPGGGTLLAAQNHFLRRDIFMALDRAVARGVKVSVVLDGGEFEGIPQESESAEVSDRHLDEWLSKYPNTDVRYKTSSYRNVRGTKQMHLKYLVVNNQYVLTGSYNWSDTSERLNWENLIRINNKEIVEQYAENFQQLQSYGSKRSYMELLTAVKDRTVKCLFPEAVTLTAQQMQTLHDAFGSWDPCRR